MTGDRQLGGRWRYEKSQCSGHEESSEGEKWKLKSQLWKESELERNTSLRESLFWFSFFYQKERFLIWKKGAGWRERERRRMDRGNRFLIPVPDPTPVSFWDGLLTPCPNSTCFLRSRMDFASSLPGTQLSLPKIWQWCPLNVKSHSCLEILMTSWNTFVYHPEQPVLSRGPGGLTINWI